VPSDATQDSKDATSSRQMKNHEGPVSLSLQLEYRTIEASQNYKTIYALLKAKHTSSGGAGGAAKGEVGADVVAIIDCSKSMAGRRLDSAKRAVDFCISELGTGDRLAIVSFNKSASVVIPFVSMDAQSGGKEEASHKVMATESKSGTNIVKGVEEALELLLHREWKNPVTSAFLLTDGQDNTTRRDVYGLSKRASENDCTIFPFGFGTDHNAPILQLFAEKSHTPFTYVEGPDQMRQAFAGAIGAVKAVRAKNIEISLKASATDGTVIKSIEGDYPKSILEEGKRATVTIPDLLEDEEKSVLIELSIPEKNFSSDQRSAILYAKAAYEDLVGKCTCHIPRAMLTVKRVRDASPFGSVDFLYQADEEVIAERQRLTWSMALKDLTDTVDSGEFDGRAMMDMVEQACGQIEDLCLAATSRASRNLQLASAAAAGASCSLRYSTDSMKDELHKIAQSVIADAGARREERAKMAAKITTLNSRTISASGVCSASVEMTSEVLRALRREALSAST